MEKRPRARPAIVVTCVVWATVLSAAAALAQAPSQALFSDIPDLAAAQVTAPDRLTRKSRLVRVNFDHLRIARRTDGALDAAPSVTLPLFDDAAFVAMLDRVDGPGTGAVWVGRIPGITGSSVTLSVETGILAGSVVTPRRSYSIRYQSPGVHRIDEVDQAQYPAELPPLRVTTPVGAVNELDVTAPGIVSDDGSTIDLMVVYTTAVVNARGGDAAARALVNLGVSETNTSYMNSGIATRLRLVHAGPVSYSESGDITQDLINLQASGGPGLSGVAALRDQHRADVTTLLVHQLPNSPACGVGYLMDTISPTFAPFAFNVVDHVCVSPNYTFAHEIGHNQGARHDWFVDSEATPQTYAHGYVNTSGRWRTIMAYNNDCAARGFNCSRLLHWANPGVVAPAGFPAAAMGVPAGTSTACSVGNTANPACDAHDARTLNETAFTVANFRAAAVVCSFTLSSTFLSAPVTGIPSQIVNVGTQTGCAWSASRSAAFISITSGSSGFGPGALIFSVAPNNGASQRTGTLTIGGQTFTVIQAGAGPTMSIDRSSLRFAAASTGAAIVAQTAAQLVQLRQTGSGAVTWTATPTVPWLQVTPASGSGNATLSISVAPGELPAATAGAIAFTFTGAGSAAPNINVTLTIVHIAATLPPFGFVDTPANPATGITGAVPFTGWALDDIDVAGVSICRSPATGEAVAPDGRCGGTAQIYVGEGSFIEGARPDVQQAFSLFPRSYAGGWGLLVLTNTLPSEGNGTFLFSIYARDREGRVSLIGTRTLTCENGLATAPFGTIDTPGQGETLGRGNYANFGWVLSRVRHADPPGGGSVTAYIDGHAVGSPCCWTSRPDLTHLFPTHPGVDRALGVLGIDTQELSEGLHTIVWTATDNLGVTSGLGSRYFRVASSDGSFISSSAAEDATTRIERTELRSADRSSASVSAPGAAAPMVARAPLDPAPIVGRRGWQEDAPWRLYSVGATGRAVIRAEEIDRLELVLGDRTGEHYSGYLRVGDSLASLPIGSTFDPQSGRFTWSPGVGFVGAYDLVFVRWAGERAIARHEARVILKAKGSGHVGARVVIDTPRMQQDVAQPFALAGSAIDLDAETGTGIDTLHVWAYPLTGEAPQFLGTAAYGARRADLADIHGERFRHSGFSVTVTGLTPGNYDIVVFPWSNVSGGFAAPTSVRVTVR